VVNASELDELDRRIVGALQVNGRASWRRIAEVLGESFRTVTRRGIALLESGTVRIAGMTNLGPTHLIEIDCEPAKLTSIAAELARNPDAIFVYALTSPSRLVLEIHTRSGNLASMVLDELPALDGVLQVNAAPVLEYFRTVADWHPGLIGNAEMLQLQADTLPVPPNGHGTVLSDMDARLIELLVADGRTPVSELTAAVGASEPAVRRRLNGLLEDGTLSVRAIVEPADIGLPIEAVLWARAAPADVREVGRLVAETPGVRYAVMAMGEYQLMINVNVRTLQELRTFLTESSWVAKVVAIRCSLVVRAYKRGGVPMQPHSS
jgi:DNA-binding Lrp family transcriptional regulator